VTAKPTVSELGIDPAAQAWKRSGHGDGAIEIAVVRAAVPAAAAPAPASAPASVAPAAAAPSSGPRAEWVLMRVTGDPDHRVLVFDRHEWECFLDGARNGEFDDAAAPRA
jgi:pyruvate/2-oxoglutarate dehydrogenase complex dihydrolipoamide acyltransferase (E2) component